MAYRDIDFHVEIVAAILTASIVQKQSQVSPDPDQVIKLFRNLVDQVRLSAPPLPPPVS